MRVRRALLAIAVLVVIGVAALTVIPVARRDAAPAAKAGATDVSAGSWKAPRTPWGDPDMEGIWGVGYVFTPLERPKELAGKEFLTDDEIAALEKAHRERRAATGPPAGHAANAARLRTSREPTIRCSVRSGNTNA